MRQHASKSAFTRLRDVISRHGVKRYTINLALSLPVTQVNSCNTIDTNTIFTTDMYDMMLRHDTRHDTCDMMRQGLADPARVGIYGWSYGGYATAMCLCKAPNTFRVGVSGAPVTAWDGYDTHYTERYMGTPMENPKGYRYATTLAAVLRRAYTAVVDVLACVCWCLRLVRTYRSCVGLVGSEVQWARTTATKCALDDGMGG